MFRFVKVLNEKTEDTGDMIQQNVLVYIQNTETNLYLGVNKNNNWTLEVTMKESFGEPHLF